MTRRMIDSSMWLNEKFAELPAMARLLQIGIINHADDQGRIKATPAYLKARIFPYDDINSDDIQSWLELMERNGTIILYIYDGKQHLQLTNWWEYQSPSFAAPSDILKPQGWCDRVRITTKGRVILTCNWITSDKVLLQSTCDEQGRPINLNGKPPVTPEPSGDDLPQNQVIDHVVNQVDDHMVDHVTTNRDEYENEITEELKLQLPRAREPDAAGASGGGSSGSSDWQAVVNAYESNIGTFTVLSSDMVKAAVDDYGSTLVVDAIKEAVRQNVRKWAYVDGILQRWHANGRASPKRTKPKTGPQTVRIFNQYTGQIEERTLS